MYSAIISMWTTMRHYSVCDYKHNLAIYQILSKQSLIKLCNYFLPVETPVGLKLKKTTFSFLHLFPWKTCLYQLEPHKQETVWVSNRSLVYFDNYISSCKLFRWDYKLLFSILWIKLMWLFNTFCATLNFQSEGVLWR